MSLSTFSGLKLAIRSNMFGNTQLTDAVLTDAVTQATAQMNRRLRTRKMLTRTAAVAEAEYMSLPTDFLAESSCTLQTSPPRRLQYRTPAEMDELNDGSGGDPTWFTIIGGEARLLPAPQSPTDMDLVYYSQIPGLSDASPTNDILDDHPDLYLFAGCMAAADYLKDEPERARYGTLFETVLADIQRMDATESFGGQIARRPRRAFS